MFVGSDTTNSIAMLTCLTKHVLHRRVWQLQPSLCTARKKSTKKLETKRKKSETTVELGFQAKFDTGPLSRTDYLLKLVFITAFNDRVLCVEICVFCFSL